MDDKVNELVEWVAKTMMNFDCSFTGNKDCDDCDMAEGKYFHCVAKQILSHKDLALIYRDIPYIGKEQDEKTSLQVLPVIPLAEALLGIIE